MSNKMWGGRFTERPDAIMEEINVSIDVDRHLYAQDIAASKAHAAMLAAQGIITANDAKNIAKGLDTILSEIGKGSFDFKRALEAVLQTRENASTNPRSALRRWPAPRSRSIATPPQRRLASTGRWPIHSMRSPIATSCSKPYQRRRSPPCICRASPRRS